MGRKSRPRGTPSLTPHASPRSPPVTAARRTFVLLLVGLSCLTLGVGLTGPCMTVIPSAGEWTGWVRVLQPRMLRPSTFSVLTGIDRMWRHGAEGLAGLLFAFSVAFPTAKLAVLAWTAAHPRADARHGWAGRLAHHMGKFSMLDVLVIGLLVVAVKGLPGGTEVRAGWALWAFAASVLLAMVASLLLHTGPRVSRDTP